MPVGKRKYNPDAEHPIFRKGREAQPAGLFALFAMIGIAILFLCILVMFALSKPGDHLAGKNFPWLFYVSTPVILLCSWSINKTKRAFRTDNAALLLRYQSWTMALSILFCVLQYFGWQQLWHTGITMTTVGEEQSISSAGAYLYVLSGLHIVHLLGGLTLLFLSMNRLVNNREGMVQSVVYFSDKREGSRISALAMYWHFLGALWCVMFVFFLLCFL